MPNYLETNSVTLPGNFGNIDIVAGLIRLNESNKQACISQYDNNNTPLIYSNLFDAVRNLYNKNQGISIAYNKRKCVIEEGNRLVSIKKTASMNSPTTYTISLGETNNGSITWNDMDEKNVLTGILALASYDEELKDTLEAGKIFLSLDENDTSLLLENASDQILITLAKISSNLRSRMNLDDSKMEQISVTDPVKISDSDKRLKYPDVVIGNFSFFEIFGSGIMDNMKVYSINGAYPLCPGKNWSDEEKSMIPVIDESYAVPSFVKEDALWIQSTSTEEHPFRNIYYKGPAGTGKTSGCMAICAALQIPYSKTTCSVDSEIFNFLGQVFPTTDSQNPITAADIIKQHQLPSVDDIYCDPDKCYMLLTGKDKPDDMDVTGIVSILMERICEEMKAILSSGSGNEFTYVESPLIKTVINGGGHEIQEPTVIKRAVLVGLNGILDPADGNYFELPNGKLVKKNPNCIIFMTSNSDYEGCTIINQSVLDRMDIVRDIDEPSDDEKKARVKAKTGFDDEKLLSRMITVMNDINQHMKENDITDGIFGMRSLQNWATAMMVKKRILSLDKLSDLSDDDIYEAAETTVLHKISQTSEDREMLRTVFDARFARM